MRIKTDERASLHFIFVTEGLHATLEYYILKSFILQVCGRLDFWFSNFHRRTEPLDIILQVTPFRGTVQQKCNSHMFVQYDSYL